MEAKKKKKFNKGSSMEFIRLTKTYEDGSHGVSNDLSMGENSYAFKNALIDALGKYEDLGYSPEEIKELVFDPMEMINIAINMERLKKYTRMAKDGKLIKFDCAVGDTVYMISNPSKLIPLRIFECKVIECAKSFNKITYMLHADINEENYSIFVHNSFDQCQIGQAFFLKKEEAEEKLKELEV